MGKLPYNCASLPEQTAHREVTMVGEEQALQAGHERGDAWLPPFAMAPWRLADATSAVGFAKRQCRGGKVQVAGSGAPSRASRGAIPFG